MSSRVSRVAAYRLRATWRRRVGGYLALALLLGLLGGIAMAAVAGARRTQSSYPAFLASTNPSDLVLQTASINPGSKALVGYDPAVIAQIRKLPRVEHVESFAELNAYPLRANGTLDTISVPVPGSVDGLYFDQDRVTITRGRRADPARANEIEMSTDVARFFHLHVGSMITWAFFDNAQNPEPGLPAAKQRPHLEVSFRLVGIGLLNDAIVQDDVDAGSASFVLFTPELTRRLTQCCTQDTETALQLEHGGRDVDVVEAELLRLARGGAPQFIDPAISVAKTQRALEPDAIALSGFGIVAALAALLIAGQVAGRQLRRETVELEALRALGAGPVMTTVDGLVGIIGAVVAGALLAAVVAVLLSPLAPIGPVRAHYPTRGIAFDWLVLGLGVATLIVVTSATALVLALRSAPHRVARRSRLAAVRTSRAARLAADAGLSAPAVSGLRFALEPGRGRNAAPMRSAIFGAALAMVVLVSTLTFGASLHTLVSRPALYGWNWNYELTGGGSVGAVPLAKAHALLDADHDVAAWSPVYYYEVRLDGRLVPLLGSEPYASVAPALLSGHGLAATDEIVLGAVTLSELHKHVGDTVTASTGLSKPHTLRIVGTATLPTIGVGGAGADHLTMGSGAVLASSLMSASARDLVGNVPPGPEGILVRLRRGIDRSSARRRLGHIAGTLTLPTNYGVELDSVQRPAEIVNYRSTTSTPAYLGAAIAAGAVVALALTLIASVRRRRHDLALLKTVGFTRRQIAATIAWQSTAAIVIGAVVGVPLGILAGRGLWKLFADQIHAVPEPIVPGSTIALVVLGGLLLANLVAVVPALTAARTSPSLLLRSE